MGPLLQSFSSDVTRLISEAADNGAVRYHCPFLEVKQWTRGNSEQSMFQWVNGGRRRWKEGEIAFGVTSALHSLMDSKTF